MPGTKAEDHIAVLSKLPKAERDTEREVTLDMSPSMRKACESLFFCQAGHGSFSCGAPVRRGHAESTHRPAVERDR